MKQCCLRAPTNVDYIIKCDMCVYFVYGAWHSVYAVYTPIIHDIQRRIFLLHFFLFLFLFSFVPINGVDAYLYGLHIENKRKRKKEQRRMKMLIEMFISACY